MKISVRMEGGLGDILCANRFIPAIKDRWPDHDIDVYLDTEGNQTQESALKFLYPDYYDSIVTIPSKKYKPFFVNTQFGIDENFGALENIPDEYYKMMTSNEYDKFYDLHIDGMKWINFDFDWKRYFYHFPRPNTLFDNIDNVINFPKGYAVLHLASNNLSNSHRMDDWYVKGLVKRISSKLPCVILSTPTTREYLNKVIPDGMENVFWIESSLEVVVQVIERASLFIGIDSGLKYIAYGLGVPVLVFSQQSPAPHQVLPSHKLRWLMFSEDCLPLHYCYSYVSDLAIRIVSNKGYSLVPQLTDFDNQAIVRNYTVNLERSKLQ